MLKELGLKARLDARDRALILYERVLAGTPVLSHATYVALSLLCLAVLLWRRTTEDVAVACLVLSAFAFALSFFVISLACDYRYLYFVDTAAIAALVYLAGDADELWSRIHDARGVASNDPSA